MSPKSENRVIELTIFLVTLILWAIAWPWVTHGYERYAAVVAGILGR